MPEEKPKGDPASIGIPPLLLHLDAVVSAPDTTPVETALFDRIQNELSFYSLPFADHKGAYRALLTRLVAALFILTEDASIRTVAGLLDALLTRMPTSAVLSFAEPEMLVAALGAPHPAANLLALDILRRAEGTEGAEVVLEREVVDSLVNCWLRSEVVEVAQRGEEAIENLLRRTARGDAALADAAQRLSLEDDENEEEYVLDMWGDLLRGKAAIAIVDICVQDTDERQASLSQTRLLGLLPRLARLDFPALASATLPRRPASSNTLLQMAIDFVDRDDIAMYLVLVQFYKDLFTQVFAAVSPSDAGNSDGPPGNPAAGERFTDFVRNHRGDTAAVRAVAELKREVQADEEKQAFASFIDKVLGAASQ